MLTSYWLIDLFLDAGRQITSKWHCNLLNVFIELSRAWEDGFRRMCTGKCNALSWFIVVVFFLSSVCACDFSFRSDYRWNAHPAFYLLPSAASSGECCARVILLTHSRAAQSPEFSHPIPPPRRVCLTASSSPTTASATWAAGRAPTTDWRWSSWTTARLSPTPRWSTWRAATVWIASSSTTASRSHEPASRG